MSLPPPGSNVTWKNYQIDTPTFQLTPVEKPDMSPFLVHMTGKNEIINILKGKNAPEEILENHGFLKVSIPQYSQNIRYQSEVVCFTESPTFALDFFRYRSFKRWNSDQRFGIGFDKENLVKAGIRPVIYVEESLRNNIITLYNNIKKENYAIDNDDLNNQLIELTEKIYPLLFPLLENKDEQGFMWEREWRNVNSFIFKHCDIKIICCPEGEETEIRDIVGVYADNIQFVRAWREYDDVTEFLKRQQQVWNKHDKSEKMLMEEGRKIKQLRGRIQELQIAKNSLNSYQEFIKRLELDRIKIESESERINQKLTELQTELTELEEKEKEKKEDEKKKKFSEPLSQTLRNNMQRLNKAPKRRNQDR